MSKVPEAQPDSSADPHHKVGSGWNEAFAIFLKADTKGEKAKNSSLSLIMSEV